LSFSLGLGLDERLDSSHKLALVDAKPKSIFDGQLALSVLLAVLELALVCAAICVGHLPLSVLLAILELALVEVTICVTLEC
jgi:hypothetical protein